MSMLKHVLASFLLIASGAYALPVFAQIQGDPNSFAGGLDSVSQFAQQNELSGERSTKDVIQTIVKWLLSLIGLIATISLVYGGYLYITSQGDESKAEQAKTIILYSVVGIIIIGISAIVVNVVISIATQQ